MEETVNQDPPEGTETEGDEETADDQDGKIKKSVLDDGFATDVNLRIPLMPKCSRRHQ